MASQTQHTHLAELLAALETYGLLLDSDPHLPSAVAIIAGERITGSWWGHPKGGEIYATLGEFHDHPDLLSTTLVDGKSTSLHRRLWPAFIAMATSGEPWQTSGLREDALELMAEVQRRGELRLDELAAPGTPEAKTLARAARTLEGRLLVAGWSLHTERGAHTKCLGTWTRWMANAGYTPPEITIEEARAELDAVLEGLNESFGGSARYPWSPRRRAWRAVEQPHLRRP